MHLRSIAFHPQNYPTRDRYPFSLPTLLQTEKIAFDTPVTLFVGENGTGKSTVLETLAHKCGIHIWRDEPRGRFEVNPYEDRLHEFTSIEWADGRIPGSFFGSSVFQCFVDALDDWAAADPGQLKYFGGKSLVTQSHGQSIMSLLSARCRIKGLYLFDEPETALSPKSQLKLLDMLQEMAAAGHAQFIIATHSPILLSCPGATLYSFDDIPVKPVRYEDTEHYRIYKQFIEGLP
jgi:predicted ATPase